MTSSRCRQSAGDRSEHARPLPPATLLLAAVRVAVALTVAAYAVWCFSGCARPSGDDAPATVGDLHAICGDSLDHIERTLQACTTGHDELQEHAEQQAAKIEAQADALDRCNAQLMRSGARP